MVYRACVVGLTGIGANPPRTAPNPALGDIMPHSHVSAYAAVPQVEIAAVCDINEHQLNRFREQWGHRLPDTRVYTDYRQMLEKENPDLLSVVTGDHVHAQIVVDSAEAGVKGIFCEKPIATTLADADRMIEACRARGIPLLIDHTRRWWPEFVQVRKLLREGAIGKIHSVVATAMGPRAMLFRNGTHLIDTMCYFVDADPEWLTAELEDMHRDHPPRYAGDGGKDPARDPAATSYIHFKNGVRGFVNMAKSRFAGSSWEIFGETGIIRVGSGRCEIVRISENGEHQVSNIAVPYVSRTGMVAAVYELIDLIENGGEGTSTGEDGRRALSILLGILQSNYLKRKVAFPIKDM